MPTLEDDKTYLERRTREMLDQAEAYLRSLPTDLGGRCDAGAAGLVVNELMMLAGRLQTTIRWQSAEIARLRLRVD